MIKLFSFLVSLMLLSSITFSQVDDRIVVNKSDLPPGLVEQLEGKKNIEKYAEYVGVGKEIGIAISEGLKAVVDEAEHFSETNVGLYTMALIAWAIVGKDIIQILIGVPLLLLGLFIILRYWRKTYLPQKRVTEKSGFFLWPVKKYEYEKELIRPDSEVTLTTFFLTLLFVAICMFIIFI
jgi:hypothetical protein